MTRMTTARLTPPRLSPPVPPSNAPEKARVTWDSLLGKPSTVPASGITITLADLPTNASAVRKFLRSVSSGAATWDTLLAADVTGDIAATRKFLRSLGSGATAGITVWDTLTAADVGPGTFGAGNFGFTGGTVSFNPGGTTTVKVGSWAPAPTYNMLTLNNDLSDASGVGVIGGGGVDGNCYLKAAAGGAVRFRVNATNVGDVDAAGYNFGGNRVVNGRKTGWSTATGSATRTTFDTTTVTLSQLAERVKALIDDLHATAGHGLVGA